MCSSSNGRVVDGAAALSAASCEDSDGDETSAEHNVKKKAKESEEGNATEEAGKDDGEGSVDDSSSRHTLDCLFPFWNIKVVVC